MSGLGSLFGAGSVAEQLLVWGVLNAVVGSAAGPAIMEIANLVNSEFPNTPIDPASAASAVARQLIDQGDGEAEAAKSGISAGAFSTMTSLATQAPALDAVLELMRRGDLAAGSEGGESLSVRGALSDQGVRPEWHNLLIGLATSIPDQAQVLNAWLEGQISESEAHERLTKAGMAPDWIQTAYNANGQAPTPVQALDMWNRGLIPEGGTGPGAVSYEQAFLEGPWRNKWLDSFKGLRLYYPPPRTVTAMYHGGQLTHSQAADYLAKQGLTPELITAYLSPSSPSSTAADKHLAKSDLITAYRDGLLTRADARKGLVALNYAAHDADLILELEDAKLATAQLSQGVTHTRTLFEAGKLSESAARATLHQLGVTDAQATAIVDTWALSLSVTTKQLSAAQIEAANHYNLLTGPDAMTLLMNLGYDEFDAWIALSVRNHAPLTDVPRPASPYFAPAPPTPTNAAGQPNPGSDPRPGRPGGH